MKTLIKLLSMVIALSFFGRWLYVEFFLLNYSSNVVEELNRGTEIDYRYVNKMAEYQKDSYNLWESCNDTLSKDLQGKITAAELEAFIPKYQDQVKKTASLSAELAEMKSKRSEEFATFKYATVYRPE